MSKKSFPGWKRQEHIGEIYSGKFQRIVIYLCEGVDKNNQPARFLMLSKQFCTQANPEFKVKKNLTIPYATARQVSSLMKFAMEIGNDNLGWY